MELVKLIETAMRGSDEKVIKKSEEIVSHAFEHLKECDPSKYEHYTREMHEVVNGPHYNEVFAEEDVAKIYYTNAAKEEFRGPHWTKAQIVAATANVPFPKGTTDCDKYVAYNAAYADFCKDFTDDQILKIAYRMWFADEDWKKEGKIWHYMNLNR